MIVAIIQARMGSTRLPRKVLMELGNKPALYHVIERVSRSKYIDDVVVATTLLEEDVPIVQFVSGLGKKVFCGSAEDVLDRYWQAARVLQPKHIVRITADCPLIDTDVMGKVIQQHLKTKADYTANTIHPTFPDGLDVSVITRESLRTAWQHAELLSEREHVVPFIVNRPQQFHIENVTHTEDLSHHRWTLDEEADYQFLSAIYKHFAGKEYITMNEVLEFLAEHPEVSALNSHINRDEGLQKSLERDRRVSKA